MLAVDLDPPGGEVLLDPLDRQPRGEQPVEHADVGRLVELVVGHRVILHRQTDSTGPTNSAGLAELAGCGVPGSADPFSRPRRGATTPPNGKFGAPLPASSAASADPLARPGTGPSLYAMSSSLRAVARRSTR